MRLASLVSHAWFLREFTHLVVYITSTCQTCDCIAFPYSLPNKM
jgi:hypothetical protein